MGGINNHNFREFPHFQQYSAIFPTVSPFFLPTGMVIFHFENIMVSCSMGFGHFGTCFQKKMPLFVITYEKADDGTDTGDLQENSRKIRNKIIKIVNQFR